jgi:putative FmdB family regulatory protein
MPLYEYYCEDCDNLFDTLRPIGRSEDPAACPVCGKEAGRIMPTTFASMSRRGGLRERVPFHHHDIRSEEPKKAIAPVKPKVSAARKTTGKAKK